VVTLNGYEKQINDIKNIPLIDNHYQIDNWLGGIEEIFLKLLSHDKLKT
jgi:hypothetical protein